MNQKIKKTDEWVVKVNDTSMDVDQLAFQHGFRNMGRVGTLKDYYLFKRLKTKDVKPPLKECNYISFHQRQIKRKRYKRSIKITDPLWANQWHIRPGNYSLDVSPLWEKGIMGEGVTIALVDDGLETKNFDIASSYNAKGSYDFNGGDNDPTPRKFDGHGTAAAGCAASPINGICGVGVAPKAKVSGIRLIAEETTDVQEAQGLSYQTQINHIFSNSWGPYDDGHRYEGPGPVLKEAIKDSIKHGRGGKGTIYVWASGNGRRNNDNCNYDGYANHRTTISIGAITDTGVVAYYSEPCSALMGVAPSSGGNNGITTCDLNGSKGYTPTDCTNHFGGTSAASPIAAGMVALMLQANPNLTWRDVQHIIAKSSVMVDISHPDWWTNQGGYKHNHDYGFGMLSATNSVNMAKSWVTVPEYLNFSLSNSSPSSLNNSSPLVVSFDPSSFNSDIDFIEYIDVTFRITHPQKGMLAISLRNAFGTTSRLTEIHSDYAGFPASGWTFGSVRHWGEPVHQRWEVVVENRSGFTGSFHSVQVKFYGYKKLAQ